MLTKDEHKKLLRDVDARYLQQLPRHVCRKCNTAISEAGQTLGDRLCIRCRKESAFSGLKD